MPKNEESPRDQHFTEQGATAVVARRYTTSGQLDAEKMKNELFEVRTFVTEPAKVSVSMGLTLNLGNFESCRIDVSLTVPCYAEETEAAYKYARSWCEDRVQTEVTDIKKNKSDFF